MSGSEFDSICDRFDASLRQGTPLSIEELLSGSTDAIRGELFRALLEIEFEYRISDGESPSVEDFQERFPGKEAILAGALANAKRRAGSSTGDETSTHVTSKEEPAEARRTPRRIIGPYKLLQQIGEGGMGTVFMAEQIEPVRRRVALKLVKAGLDRREVLSRFEAERQALALMDHPNIAKVLDAGTDDEGRPYFVMELVNGIPITKYCDNYKLNLNERLKLFVQACRAIQHAHQKGIIHRDVKPSNVLVTQHDGIPVAKVIDFGLAKALQNSQRLTDKTMFTEFGQVVGTLQYMSPEQSEMNALDVDTRSDVYSLGVLLYELLTGTTPIEKKTLKKMALDRALVAIREEEAPRPSMRLSSLGDSASVVSLHRKTDPKKLGLLLKGDLDWISIKALEKDRNRRYESPHDLADDVSRFLANEPVEARSPSLIYRLQKLVAKHRRAALITFSLFALQLVALAGSTTFFWWQSAQSRQQSAKSRQLLSAAKQEKADALKQTAAALQQSEDAESRAREAKQQRIVAEEKQMEAEAATDRAKSDLEKTRKEFEGVLKSMEEAAREEELSQKRAREAEEKAAESDRKFKEAELTAEDARSARDRLQQLLDRQVKASYRDKIRLAKTAWNRGDFSGYAAALRDCPEELRGWEHDYLNTLSASGRRLIKDVSCYTANEQFLVVGSMQNTVDIYTFDSKERLRRFNMEFPVQRLSVAPSSDVFLAELLVNEDTQETQASAYSISTGKLSWTGPIGSLSPDGRWVAFARDGEQVIESLESPNEQRFTIDAGFRPGSWCGTSFLVVEADESYEPKEPKPLHVWSLENGGELLESELLIPYGFRKLQVFPSQGKFAIEESPGSFRFFRLEERTAELTEAGEARLPKDEINPFKFTNSGIRFRVSPELRRLAMYSFAEPVIKIYALDTQTPSDPVVIKMDSAPVNVQWTAGSSAIAVMDFQGRIATYEVDEDTRKGESYGYKLRVTSEDQLVAGMIAAGKQSEYLVFDSVNAENAIEVRAAVESEPDSLPNDKTCAVRLDPLGLYTLNTAGDVHFLPVENGLVSEPVRLFQASRGYRRGIRGADWLSPRHLAVLSDRGVEIWDVKDKTWLMDLASVEDGFALDWCPKTRRLAVSTTSHVFIWDVPEAGFYRRIHPNRVLEIPEPNQFTHYLKFSPDGRYLCADSFIWDVTDETSKLARRIPPSTRQSEVTNATFSPAGDFLVVGHSNGVVQNLQFPSFALASEMIGFKHLPALSRVKFTSLEIDPSDDQCLFATTVTRHTSSTMYLPDVWEAKLMDLTDGSERLSFTDLTGFRAPLPSSVQAARFSRDSSRIFAITKNGQVVVLDASISMGGSSREGRVGTSAGSTSELDSDENLIDLETPPPTTRFRMPSRTAVSEKKTP